MIEIKILASPDQEQVGTYKTFKNNISIGRSRSNDLIIMDNDILNNHVYITIQENVVFLKSKNQGQIIIDENKIIGKKKINTSSNIKIGCTEFKLNSYRYDKVDYDEVINNNKSKILNDMPTVNSLLEYLELELKVLNYESNKKAQDSMKNIITS